MIKSKKLSSLVAASLILAGGSLLGVQTVSAQVTDQEFNEVRQGVNANYQEIGNIKSQLSASKDYSSDIATNKDKIAANEKAIADEATARDQAVAQERAERKGADAAQDKVIQQVNQNVADGFDTINKNIGIITDQLNKNDLAEQQARDAADKVEAKTRADKDTEHDTAIAANKKDIATNKDKIAANEKAIADEATARDQAVAQERAERKGADAAQDKVIQQVNQNVADGFDTINKNIGIITDQLNKNDLAEQQARVAGDKAEAEARDAADKNLQKDIAGIQDTLKNANAFASADATKAANDAAENANKVANNITDRVNLISNNQNVTSESDLIKKDQSIGQNVTNVDAALHKEIGDRIGADKAQDKRINEVNTNVKKGFDTINTNIRIITDQLNKNDLAEQQARDAADKAEAKARDAADKNLQANINNEAKLRDEADQNLQNNLNKAVNAQAGFNKAQAGINDTLTKAVTNNSKAIVANAEAAKNLEKHLKETDGRVDKANAEIHTNAGNIAQNKDNIAANKKAIGDEAAARESGDNALQSQIKKESAARQADISRLDNKIHDVSKEVDTVGALSMAMSGLHPLSYDEGDARFQLSAAVGTYDGTEALALGGFYHFNRDSMLSVGVATDLGADEHRMGANVGYTRRIGQGGHVSRPSEGTVSDIMKDIKNLEQKQAKLEQENEQLKQQLASLKK